MDVNHKIKLFFISFLRAFFFILREGFWQIFTTLCGDCGRLMASGLVFFCMRSLCILGGAALLVFSALSHFLNKKWPHCHFHDGWFLDVPKWANRLQPSEPGVPTAVHPPPSTSIRRALPLRRPPPSAAPPSRGEQREHRRRPSASEPRAERYTPNTRSPAFAASYWYGILIGSVSYVVVPRASSEELRRKGVL